MTWTRGHGLGDAVASVERVERVPLKPGNAGTDQTIDVMSRAAMGRYGAGSGRIRNLTLQVVREAGVAERDKAGEIVAVHEYVKNHLRYVKDPLWYEFVTHPETLAFERADGDCDDHVTLEAAMLGSIGIPSRFVVYGFKGAPQYQHVAMHANVGGNQWVALDPIVKDQPAGWEAPDATSRKVYGMNTPDGPQGGKSLADMVGIVLGLAALWGMFRAAMKRLEGK